MYQGLGVSICYFTYAILLCAQIIFEVKLTLEVLRTKIFVVQLTSDVLRKNNLIVSTLLLHVWFPGKNT